MFSPLGTAEKGTLKPTMFDDPLPKFDRNGDLIPNPILKQTAGVMGEYRHLPTATQRDFSVSANMALSFIALVNVQCSLSAVRAASSCNCSILLTCLLACLLQPGTYDTEHKIEQQQSKPLERRALKMYGVKVQK